MRKNSVIKETIVAIFFFMIICTVVYGCASGIGKELDCNKMGYAINIDYGGEVWCFGKDGKPEVARLR